MPCPHCQSPRIQEQPKRTSLGYRTFRCTACTRHLNERSGTPFNDPRVPTDLVFLVVLWRLRYPLRLRHLAEMFLERGLGGFMFAARFCSAHDELRAYLRHRTRMHEVVPPGSQREQYRARSAALRAMLRSA